MSKEGENMKAIGVIGCIGFMISVSMIDGIFGDQAFIGLVISAALMAAAGLSLGEKECRRV